MVTSTRTSLEAKTKAIQELTAFNDKFSGSIQNGVIQQEAFKRILKEVRAEITLNARAAASASLVQEQYQKYLK